MRATTPDEKSVRGHAREGNPAISIARRRAVKYSSFRGTSKRPRGVRAYVRAHNRPSYPVENFKRSLIIPGASRTNECLIADSLYIILSRRLLLFFPRPPRFFAPPPSARRARRVRRVTDRDYRGFLYPIPSPVSEIYLPVEART